MVEEKMKKLRVNGENGEDDVVTPWNVESKNQTGIDYDKLIGEYFQKIKKNFS